MFPSHSSLLIFVSAAALLLAVPGPAVFYIVGRSIGHSRNGGLISALGIGVGTLIHTAAAAVGLSALLVSSATAFSVVKYLGAAYLIYLGVKLWRAPVRRLSSMAVAKRPCRPPSHASRRTCLTRKPRVSLRIFRRPRASRCSPRACPTAR